MMHGLDTYFLVAAELTEHTAHADARTILARLLAVGDLITIAPQILAETWTKFLFPSEVALDPCVFRRNLAPQRPRGALGHRGHVGTERHAGTTGHGI